MQLEVLNVTADLEIVAEVENLRNLQTEVLVHLVMRIGEWVLSDGFLIVSIEEPIHQ